MIVADVRIVIKRRKKSRNMGGERTALEEIRQGRAHALKRSMAGEEADFEIPVVDPAEISVPGERKVIMFTTSQMMSLGEMRGTNDRWRQLVEALKSREGTIKDVSHDILENGDPVELIEARQGPLDVDVEMVFSVLRGRASWAELIRVECWLRDAVMMEQSARGRAAAVKLWAIALASYVGEEAIRQVVEKVGGWVVFKPEDEQCSGGGTDMVAQVAWRRAMSYHDYLWTAVMLAVDVASAEVLWDWRRSEHSCFTHSKLDCPDRSNASNGVYGPIRAYYWTSVVEREHGWRDTLSSELEDEDFKSYVPPNLAVEEDDDEEESCVACGVWLDEDPKTDRVGVCACEHGPTRA